MTALLKIPEVSAMTGVPEATLRFYRHQGTGPKSFKLGRRVMYREEDVTAWVQAQYEAGGQRDPQPAA
jgi:predicted DNA-binding transcriptional regulator AlpA